MPAIEDANQKGNLIIEFDIEYPNFLHPGNFNNFYFGVLNNLT